MLRLLFELLQRRVHGIKFSIKFWRLVSRARACHAVCGNHFLSKCSSCKLFMHYPWRRHCIKASTKILFIMENDLCALWALHRSGVPTELLRALARFPVAPLSCHPCGLSLLTRAAREMMHAAQLNQWDVAATKLHSVVLLLREGFLAVFAENLSLQNGQVRCGLQDYARFDSCCVPL